MAKDAVCGNGRITRPHQLAGSGAQARGGTAMAGAEQELRAQQALIERIARGAPLAQTLTELCRQAEERFPGSFCTVLTVDRSGGVLRHSASPSLPREFAEQIDGLPVAEGMGACGTAAARGLAVTVQDIFSDPLTAGFLDLAARFDLHAVWSQPLLSPGGQVMGTFAVYRSVRHRPDEHEQRYVANAANLAALAIDRAASEMALRAAADLDSLTGLPNRARLLEIAGRELQVRGRRLGLMLLEVDRFSAINDSLGHLAGEQLLLEVADRVRATVGERGTVSRFGVDVFSVLVPGAQQESLQQLADQVMANVRRPIEVDGVELMLTVSIGIAIGARRTDAFTLVRDADAAMRAARAAGPGHQHVFDRRMRVATVTRLRTEQELRVAIDERQLVMHYQPILDLRAQCWAGVEALVRWQHPRRGLVTPDHFIPLAEEAGLIVPLGELVFEMVAQQARSWSALLPSLRFAVNASVVQLADPLIAGKIERILAEAGVHPSTLVLEVTESALMQQLDSTRGALERLVGDGADVMIDDFGTGYSSLARLGELPISGLKIDRRFVRGLGCDPQVHPVVRAIADLARAHELVVVVEGIEDELALSVVRELDCEFAQGYHLGRPAPADAVFELLEQPLRTATAIA